MTTPTGGFNPVPCVPAGGGGEPSEVTITGPLPVPVDLVSPDPVNVLVTNQLAEPLDVNVVSPDPVNVLVTNQLAEPLDVNVVSNSGPVATYPVTNPAFTGGYVYSRAQTPGVAGPNNFLALYNPVGSPRTLVVAGVFISSTIVGDIVATVDPMRGWLAAAISGGDLEPAAAIGKVRSTMPAPSGQVFINNPAATLGASWFNSPPVLGTAKQASPFVHQIPASVAAGPITLLPGEGTVIRTETGDVDQRWNVSIAWSEV